ncbi:hypothetical protein [Flavobacterium branchiophilum]|uniref:Lipoprotein n=1 Tax=Flavobacterium branchiophilum TaxID=55197 RepID=A0A2H3L0R2_9FLAO|nr:hypothetical protein [Flavobacterium branchiophilum]PDS26250.1 hypothetical protein B0A77_02755 [Flavobacterium branchiophilum]
MKYIASFLPLIILLALISCRDDFEFVASNGTLAFSEKTIYLDTVFSDIGSSTYTLKVYNRSAKDIKIPVIKLAKGNASKYRITVDGMTGDVGSTGKVFSNVELLAKDSLYIFIETTANITDANPTDFLYTDEIQFDSGTNLQKVDLVTLIQDAYFIFPNKENGTYESVPFGIDAANNTVNIWGRNLQHDHLKNGNEFQFKTDKPYVIYGFASVPDGETLHIPAGARVHFHAESGLIVQNNATLNIAGTVSTGPSLENEVVFEGDRLEPNFSDVAGQWGFVYLRQGSLNNSINHLTLKNATIGLFAVDCNLNIQNSQIYDCTNYGILGRKAQIDAKNVIINNAGQATLACTTGGSYNFVHCTLNNNWSNSQQVALYIDNYILNANNQQVPYDLVACNFVNCIVYGSNNVALFLSKNDSKLFNFNFNHSLFKFNDANTQIATNVLYESIRNEQNGNKKNLNPNFVNVSKNKLWLSQALTIPVNVNYANFNDILNYSRNVNPNLGAYQYH